MAFDRLELSIGAYTSNRWWTWGPPRESVTLEGVLVGGGAAGADERGDRPVFVDCLVELAVERKPAADPRRIDVRPGQDAVRLPHLDAEDVVLCPNAVREAGDVVSRDDDVVAADELRADDAVDVARERCPLGAQSLRRQRMGEEPAERGARRCADHRGGEQEDVQERDRPLEVTPAAPQPPPRIHRPYIGRGARCD
jgi:hypothetical protein